MRFSLLFVCVAAFWCFVEAKNVMVMPLVKKHRMLPQVHYDRWLRKGNERRRQRGLPAWTKPEKRTIKRQSSVPVSGDVWPVSIYATLIQIGTPAQVFPVAIDSGSYVLYVPGQGCSGCINTPPNNIYYPKKSSSAHQYTCGIGKGCALGTCHPIKRFCSWTASYETCVPTNPTEVCTISGVWYNDKVTFGNITAVPTDFGAITYQTSGFYQFLVDDGVVGMITSASGSSTSVLSQLFSQGSIPALQFGLCLQPGSVSNGTMTLGGADSRFYSGSIQWTPDVGQGQYYGMQVNAMSIGAQSVTVAESEVIIDSGTNILLLPDESYSSMLSALQAMCSTTNLHGICDVSSGQTLFDGVCYDFTQSQINAFPNITINVPGIALTMTPANYILQNYGNNFTKPGQYCLGIDNTGPAASGSLFIVGDTLLLNYYTVFDPQNTRIGWAPVTSACGSVNN